MGDSFPLIAVAGIFAVVFGAIGVHQAVNRLLNIVDGHLERFQGKLDIMLAAQIEHNEKIDMILRKLY